MKKLQWTAASALLAFATGAAAVPEGPEANTPEWFQREATNYARTLEAPTEELTNPVFMQAWETQSLANMLELAQRNLADPSWILPPTLNSPVTPLCTSWAEQCTGDPFRYAAASSPDGDNFYNVEAEVIPFVIYDDGCARLSGRVWAPRGSHAGSNLPNVVIENGSVQAPEPIYWWFAQTLVRAGYVVLTFDPRGQGRSDLQTPDFQQGGNFNSAVFWEGLVNVIDFFRSNPVAPYPHNATCADTYPTEVTAFNPFHDRIDLNRLGIAGHSLGASGVSRVQAYGAPGEDPWPGKIDSSNPVKAVVAWDSLNAVTPRVPSMGQSSEYGIGGTPFTAPPGEDDHKGAYAKWAEASVPVYQITIQGSTHFEWSLIPSFPATSWCKDTSNNTCRGGWGNPLADHYSLAWFDRWLKNPGESGYDDADARLLADADWCERYSFYYRSARKFNDRSGKAHLSDDIRLDCLAGKVDSVGSGGGTSTPPASNPPTTTPPPTAEPPATQAETDDGGGAFGEGLLLVLLAGAGLRRTRHQ